MAETANCTACGDVADCNPFNVHGYRDCTASDMHVFWVGWLCPRCERDLLAVLEGGASGTPAGADESHSTVR